MPDQRLQRARTELPSGYQYGDAARDLLWHDSCSRYLERVKVAITLEGQIINELLPKIFACR